MDRFPVRCAGGGRTMLSTGKLRGLQQVADSDGFLTMCAIDHRGALQKALNPQHPQSVSYDTMVAFKLDLCQAVSDSVSAVLLDPCYGAAQAISAGMLPGSVGLLVSLEKTGYSGESTARISELLPGWSVKKARRMGASAVKLLVYFRPDLKDIAAKQLDLVAGLAETCIRQDILFLVEPVTYPIESEDKTSERFAAKKPELVIETARQITQLPIDILKSEFPVDPGYERNESSIMEYCRELDKASRLPWVLLSAGVGFDLFRKEVEIACKAGASGFLAGRALWQEGVEIESRSQRMNFFRETAVERLSILIDLVQKYAQPWWKHHGSVRGQMESIDESWYANYPEN